MTNDVNSFITYPISLGIKIARIVSLRLDDSLILKNLLYLPDFRLNLLSISQLTKELRYKVIFHHGTFMIHDHTKEYIHDGKDEHIWNIYVLNAVDTSCSTPIQQQFASCSNVVDVSLWYNRLGYPSISKTYSIIDVLGFKQTNKENVFSFSLRTIWFNKPLISFILAHGDPS